MLHLRASQFVFSRPSTILTQPLQPYPPTYLPPLLAFSGEHGVVPEGRANAGETYHLKGKPFYRIIHGFIDQAGASTDSVFGGQFKDDPGGLKLKHDRKVSQP